MIDLWKDIKGYEGRYQVSYEGKIRSIYKNGKTRELTPYIKNHGRKILQIGLSKNGVKKEIPVHTIVAQAFIGEPKAGQVVYHKNGLIRDNWASNLEYIDRKTLGEMTGPGSRRKSVAKINADGEIVAVYTSARQAAKENFMSYQTIVDRCNRKVKSPFAPDGYAYAWEDSEVSIKHAIGKIEEYRKAACLNIALPSLKKN